MIDNIEEFKTAIRSVGLVPPDRIVPGKFHRFPGIGKEKGSTAGWCQLFPDCMGGVFGDFSTDLSEKWQAARAHLTSEAERTAYHCKIEESIKEAQAKRREEQEEAATKAQEIWKAAQPANPSHPYLAQKRIHDPKIKQQANGDLLIPLQDNENKIWALQTIDADGNKRFHPPGCRTKGLFYFIGGRPAPGKPICLCEGFATAAAIAQAGYTVVAAFSAGNLSNIAEMLQAEIPGRPLILCADDDCKEGTDQNPGIEAATKAAMAVGGKLAVPAMGKKADAWDLWSEHGSEAIKKMIETATDVVTDRTLCDGTDFPSVTRDPTLLLGCDAVTDNTPLSDNNTLQKLDQGTGRQLTSQERAEIIKHLAALSPVDYEVVRKDAAEKLGLRSSVLDHAINEFRKSNVDTDLPFEIIEPWPEPVDPAEVLNDIAATIQRFIICNQEVSHAVTLWVAMTWFMDVVQVAPLAVITAPEKRCGKTMLLTLLGKLSARSVTASSISPAALYRSIELWKPTLLIDEVDACLKDNEELRGILNAGHTRDSAYTFRCVGDNHEPKKFNLWGAKALSGIGHVADTLMDRAVVFELRRKLPDEQVERIRYAEPTLFADLRAKLARFAVDCGGQVRLARPDLPSALNDRAQDNWEPLLAIAMVAGDDWLEIATAAALKLSASESSTQTVGTELLADIKEIFETQAIERITTADLLNALCEDEEKLWAAYNRGRAITPKQLANKLRGYGITSKTIRVNSFQTAKGYERNQFEEAFSRYVDPPALSVTTSQSPNNKGSRVTDGKSVPSQPRLEDFVTLGNVIN